MLKTEKKKSRIRKLSFKSWNTKINKYIIVSDFTSITEKQCCKYDKQNINMYNENMILYNKLYKKTEDTMVKLEAEPKPPPEPNNQTRYNLWLKRNSAKNNSQQTKYLLYLISKGFKININNDNNIDGSSGLETYDIISFGKSISSQNKDDIDEYIDNLQNVLNLSNNPPSNYDINKISNKKIKENNYVIPNELENNINNLKYIKQDKIPKQDLPPQEIHPIAQPFPINQTKRLNSLFGNNLGTNNTYNDLELNRRLSMMSLNEFDNFNKQSVGRDIILNEEEKRLISNRRMSMKSLMGESLVETNKESSRHNSINDKRHNSDASQGASNQVHINLTYPHTIQENEKIMENRNSLCRPSAPNMDNNIYTPPPYDNK